MQKAHNSSLKIIQYHRSNKTNVTGGSMTRSSGSYSDTFVRSCEVLDLETQSIFYAGDLQGPESYIQMVTFATSATSFEIATFASSDAVAEQDMVVWDPASLEWNKNFAGAGTTGPSRFGAAVVSKIMICPNSEV